MVLYNTVMEIKDSKFLYVLTNIRQRLFTFLEKELAKENITGIAPSDGDILYVLDRKGTITLQELARHTIKDKSTISSVVKKLEASGYVTKERDVRDARRTNLRLTSEARRLRPVLFEISRRMNAKLFRGFTEEEKIILFTLIGKVYRNL